MHLQQPEYLHVLLNPLPVYGLFIGVLAMLIAPLLRNRRAEVLALALVLFSALSALPVAAFGDKGYDRVLTLADEDGQAWLAAHAERGKKLLPVFPALAALAAAAALIPFRWPRWRRPLWYGTLAGALLALGCGGWLGYSGGKIRHKEFRYTPPPPVKTGAFLRETGLPRSPQSISIASRSAPGAYPLYLCALPSFQTLTTSFPST